MLQPDGDESQFVPDMQELAGQVSVPQAPLGQLTSQPHESRQSIVPHELAP
jgi:hypothetical protein